MPIIIPKEIPAFFTLSNENVFVMTAKRAYTQDIRPIEIAILNLMPTKISTETQLMRVLGNSPLQVNVTLLATSSYQGKNTSVSHLEKFYRSFDEVKTKKFDGMIITGAPVETLPFEEVMYWEELKEIMDFAKARVTSTMYICWGAQAGLYHHYGIEKVPLESKLFGVFENTNVSGFDPLMKGLDEVFFMPHSRHTAVLDSDILEQEDLKILAYSSEAGASIVKSNDNKSFFVTGHMEYDKETLKAEYERDLAKGLEILPPKNYFVNDDESKIVMNWASTANIIFSNWLNYYVYQVTPFDIEKVNEEK